MHVSRIDQATRRSRTTLAKLATSIVAIIAVVLMCADVSFATTSNRMERLEALVFRTPMSSFLSIARHRSGQDATFDWSTDHCSAPLIGSTGRSFDFTAACTRHDFAYRNFKRADAAGSPRGTWWNSSMRRRIDLQFQKDMKEHCAHRGLTDRVTCLSWSEMFFRLVRIAGGP